MFAVTSILRFAANGWTVGCIGQAWSIAEVLRVAMEDVCGIRPARRPADLLDAVAQWPT
jgi:glycogen debranching enzyme